jgi:hypothetical protein
MKKLIGLLIVALLGQAMAMAQPLQTPLASPPQNVKQDFGLSSIEVSYSRPGVKGRKIFGELVPFGKVWRTGANQATTISFGDDVTIDGNKLPAGKYGLLTIPGPETWTIIFSKQLDVTSPAAYHQDQDVLRVNEKVTEIPFSLENFMITFNNLTASSCDLQLIWDQSLINLPIKTNIDDKIMAEIDNHMNKDNRPYYSAAFYYLENGKDLNKALEWFNKAAEQDPKAFFVYYQKARCEAKLGRKADAVATAKHSIELARAAGNDDYVGLNEKLIASLP